MLCDLQNMLCQLQHLDLKKCPARASGTGECTMPLFRFERVQRAETQTIEKPVSSRREVQPAI